MRVCKKCNLAKEIEEFYTYCKRGVSYRERACVRCRRTANDIYKGEHKEAIRLKQRQWYFKRAYGDVI